MNNSGFSRHILCMLRYFISLRIILRSCKGDLPPLPARYLHRSSHSRLMLCTCVPTVLLQRSTGISTCCPSATPFGLALGPDLPRADQLYPGNLGYSAIRILTLFSLLIPAFSLQCPPRLLIGTASMNIQCSSTNHALHDS